MRYSLKYSSPNRSKTTQEPALSMSSSLSNGRLRDNFVFYQFLERCMLQEINTRRRLIFSTSTVTALGKGVYQSTVDINKSMGLDGISIPFQTNSSIIIIITRSEVPWMQQLSPQPGAASPPKVHSF